jgi:rubrerythrin
MTTAQHVVAAHNLNRTQPAIKVSRQAWMKASETAELPQVRVCIQCGYTGGFTHIYNGAHPECPMCKGE